MHRRASASKQDDRVNLDRLASAEGVEPFVGLALDVDAIDRQVHEGGDGLDHRALVRGDLGPFEDDRGVEVDDRVACGVGATQGLGEKVARVASGVLGCVVGEELTQVGQGQSAEHGIGDRMEHGVAVGVGDGADIGRDGHSGKDEGADGLGCG